MYPPFEPVEDIDAEHLPETDPEPDSGRVSKIEPEDELPEEDPDDEPLADEEEEEVPVGAQELLPLPN